MIRVLYVSQDGTSVKPDISLIELVTRAIT